MRFRLTIEYAGTRYSGWQIQKNARTIQGEIEHLDIQTTLPAETMRRRINDALPADIHILRIDKVPHRFHARHDAVARSYIYHLSRRRTAFSKPFVWWVKEDLDVSLMRDAAKQFVGMHDFRSFSDDDPAEKSTDVLIDTLEIHEDGDLIVVHVEGSHFIWKMVRRLVGVLVEVGRGELPGERLPSLLTGTSPLPARLTAPASGLFLERVYYKGDRRDLPVHSPVVVTRY
jgi:tRNA pseudouridine38-40 synthase